MINRNKERKNAAMLGHKLCNNFDTFELDTVCKYFS